MEPTERDLKLVRLNYTQRIAHTSNETGQRISGILQKLAIENQKHETIVDDFLDFANEILPALNRKQQLNLNGFVKSITDLKLATNETVTQMLELLNEQNQLTQKSTQELKDLIEKGI